MRCILVGPPGCGKGTLSGSLIKELGLAHISTGDIFRAHRASQSEFGKRIAMYLDKGSLVPDELVLDIVFDRLEQPDCEKGFILDGFPRTLAQAEALQSYFEKTGKALDVVANFNITDDVLVQRIITRRICSKCNAVYNVSYHAPKQENICDECGGELIHRRDDHEDVVRERLKVYHASTEPLIDYYRKKNLLLDLNADQGSEQVKADFFSYIRGKNF
ncbi:adenylate kinase [bacterium]|nr:adenylate kinase [bacterium]